MTTDRKLGARFYVTAAGAEPVRDWLKEGLSRAERGAIGADIATVQSGWPLGMPLVRKMDDKLWEVRIDLPTHKIARVLFTTLDKEMVLLHGFIKKSQETPQSDLDLSKKRRDEVHNEQAKQEKAKPKARRK